MRKKGIILFFLFCFLSFSNFAQNSLINAWDSVPGILSRIKAPQFQSNIFNILDYGAVAGGVTLSTSAINNAINACTQAGGGTVLVPSGTFLTGAITLKSNVNFLYFGSDIFHYC
jgi:polygalacturonase